MTVGGASQTVTVTSAPPALKTDRADVGQVLDERQIQNLPNLNRNFTSFALLTPGVQRSSFNIAPTENPQGTTALNANGSNYGTLGYVLDGTDNREPVDGIIVINPTLDSISEMKVDTQNFPAEFGGSVGGVVTAQTRSGGNAFHGDAFFYRRSDALAARNPFTQFQPDPVTGRLIPSALYSQFGGSVGGPIKKEKAFFFLDYQGTRQKVGSSLQQNVPTATVRNTCLNPASPTCDLSQYGGGVISNARVTPQGRALLSAFPQPNAGAPGATTNNYIASGSGNNDGDLADTRLDYQVTPTIHAFGRYDYANFRLFGAPALGAAGGEGFGIGNTSGTDQVQNQSVSVGFDWALRANLLTDFRFGFLDYHVAENKFDVGTTPATAAGLPNLNTGALDTSGSPTFNVVDNSISPFGTQGCNCPLQESEQVFQTREQLDQDRRQSHDQVRRGYPLRIKSAQRKRLQPHWSVLLQQHHWRRLRNRRGAHRADRAVPALRRLRQQRSQSPEARRFLRAGYMARYAEADPRLWRTLGHHLPRDRQQCGSRRLYRPTGGRHPCCGHRERAHERRHFG